MDKEIPIHEAVRKKLLLDQDITNAAARDLALRMQIPIDHTLHDSNSWASLLDPDDIQNIRLFVIGGSPEAAVRAKNVLPIIYDNELLFKRDWVARVLRTAATSHNPEYASPDKLNAQQLEDILDLEPFFALVKGAPSVVLPLPYQFSDRKALEHGPIEYPRRTDQLQIGSPGNIRDRFIVISDPEKVMELTRYFLDRPDLVRALLVREIAIIQGEQKQALSDSIDVIAKSEKRDHDEHITNKLHPHNNPVRVHGFKLLRDELRKVKKLEISCVDTRLDKSRQIMVSHTTDESEHEAAQSVLPESYGLKDLATDIHASSYSRRRFGELTLDDDDNMVLDWNKQLVTDSGYDWNHSRLLIRLRGDALEMRTPWGKQWEPVPEVSHPDASITFFTNMRLLGPTDLDSQKSQHTPEGVSGAAAQILSTQTPTEYFHALKDRQSGEDTRYAYLLDSTAVSQSSKPSVGSSLN